MEQLLGFSGLRMAIQTSNGMGRSGRELPNARVLPVGMPVVNNTIEICTKACFDAGYRFAGAEYAVECYCASTLSNATSAPLNECNMPCNGNSSQYCGGPNRVNIFNYTGVDLPTESPGNVNTGGASQGTPALLPVTSGLPGTWKYAGCYVDNAHGRIMEHSAGSDKNATIEKCISTCDKLNLTVAGMEYGRLELANSWTSQACGAGDRLSIYTSSVKITALPVPIAQSTDLPGKWGYDGCYSDNDTRVLPWKIWDKNNTVSGCLDQCAAFGYTAAGLEYGEECYCGDSFDIVPRGGHKVPESECSTLTFGTNRRLQVVTRVVVPLIATVGINNKVTFLEKAGTGPPNSTGAYELDLSLAYDSRRAWREMHVKTDVFCSGSIILPDKAGRQLNVGGWSADSLSGVRLYTPDGAPGKNSTNDWEEDVNLLSLQRPRWYPTAAMLPNGSVLVVGGEVGSNAAAQPNLEILPKPEGGYVVDLDWLNRTDPNNLYPFVVVLPSGRLFVAYYNEARILDAHSFETVRVLPNIPGAVNNLEGGRSYPLEGSLVVFPQHPPYSQLTVLICGGAAAFVPLDNCVSIQPEADDPSWIIERMPSQRVMPCITALPDGTFLILNGAQKGIAGFNLASEPNLDALLYDPSQPIRQRISILNSTIVPRLYHSEATLLPDGRVLVSGSDPQTDGFSEEYRIEVSPFLLAAPPSTNNLSQVYVPPYSSQGLRQPRFSLQQNDWQYGQQYVLSDIKLYHGSVQDIRISLIAATSSTHGNTMGSRTIFPAFSCVKTTCTVTAPPNAFVSPPGWHQLFILDGPTPSHSQWVRIGGDPAQLGNWPQQPGFTPPGM
ncbi:copper radical oxidase [Moniliophthora roreri]|nr:copper radical oxidase [Moniliophthora roreri]